MKKTKSTTGAKLSMPCPFCGDHARVKVCKVAEGKAPAYHWMCECRARGFFTETHYRELDKLKKLSVA